MNHELAFFFQSVLWGACLLFFYDLLRIGRRLFPRGAFFVSVEDLLYWTMCGVFLFGKMYQANEGSIRAYAVVAVVLGMVLYANSISAKFVQTAVKILEIPIKFLNSVEKRLLFAARQCKILVWKRLRAIKRSLKRGRTVEEKSGNQA